MTPARERVEKLPPYRRLRDLPGVGDSITDDYMRIGINDPTSFAVLTRRNSLIGSSFSTDPRTAACSTCSAPAMQ